jgi:dienelactone hydrolase
VGIAIVLALAVALAPLLAHVRAASLLVRFADEHATGGLADLGRSTVDEEDATVTAPAGRVQARARIYTPRGRPGAPGVVLVHGVHRLSIDEPRMVRFARALASTGLVVLTPEVRELADYRIDPRSIDTIGAAVVQLAARMGGRAGLMGMSFAGGLSLLAAADPRFASSVAFVVAIGAHHDLARVSRFFATNQAPRPEGPPLELEAHGYGALVLVYQRAESFFTAGDVEGAREAIRLWLWNDRDAARARADQLCPESWAKLDALFEGPSAASDAILEVVDRDAAAMATVSPSGHLAGLTAPVFLLHGAGDNVIPSSETEWLAREIPVGLLREALVSKAIVHVELGREMHASETWALVHFMAGVLEAAAP